MLFADTTGENIKDILLNKHKLIHNQSDGIYIIISYAYLRFSKITSPFLGRDLVGSEKHSLENYLANEKMSNSGFKILGSFLITAKNF